MSLDQDYQIKNRRYDFLSTLSVHLIHKSKLEDVKKFFRQLSIEYSGNHADTQRSWDQYRNDTKAVMHDMDRENRHLKEMM